MSLYKKTIKCIHHFLRGVVGFEKVDLGVLILQKNMGREDPPYSDKTVEQMLAKAQERYPEGFYSIDPLPDEPVGEGLHEVVYALEVGPLLQPAQ